MTQSSLLESAITVCQHRYEHFSQGVGDYGDASLKQNCNIKCIFSPSLADLCGHEFAAVVIDEGIRIKGESTIIGRAVRELDPLFRLVLTATPIKNRLRDLFWLLHWAAGGSPTPTARCPYTNESDQQDQFAGEFNVCERNLSAEARVAKAKGKTLKKGKRKKARGKPGVQICNIHRLWKFIAPNVLRRRKEDIGEDIVAKRKQIIRVPMGTKQYEVYKYHLTGQYLDKNGQVAYMAKLQALRSAAAAPNSELLKQLAPECEGENCFTFRSDKDYTPKMAAALNVIEQRMRLGEQTLLGSALLEPLDTISKRLTQAGIPHDVLDGRMSPHKRGQLGAEFKAGLPHAKPVLLAGLKAMAEGNNWPLCNNAAIMAYEWAYDVNEQFPDRCRRLDSVKDLNVWPIICIGSIDRKMEAGYDEKGDASELVLDGSLIGEDVQEVNLAELLRIAEREFKQATHYPEDKLEAEWPELKEKLAEAWKVCKRVTTKPRYQPPVIVQQPLDRLLQRIKEMEVARIPSVCYARRYAKRGLGNNQRKKQGVLLPFFKVVPGQDLNP